ncbi:hypothetical protein FEM48_Zijuj10G0131300 [Ziziphus jujuba var. spinosa]|uniref:RING-CH-type domain-containing protein n=1 Tax=Ziziphus jujuba var. spinosa TaxID=714518 RepID=A0A978UNJ7_ZIZJJ|nr:hypothetical protein FEM48_Zijuj10G0131300 [Ziziphus jujuba var. spinosa]
MGDHFVLLVDRLLTESTLEAAIESKNRLIQSADPAAGESKNNNSSQKMDFGNISFPRKLVECRICHDEEEDSNMETPCSCCGSLKYAHRRCVQRWCNEKGDTTCEICHQPFKSGYTAPPPLFRFGRIPMNFRGNWEISRRDINRPRIIAMVSTDRNFLDPDNDDHTALTTRSFMVLLILRHTLPLIISGNNDFSFPLLLLLFLRTAGVVLPVYIVVRAVTAIQHRRTQQEVPVSSITSSDEETTEHLTLQPQPHIIHV